MLVMLKKRNPKFQNLKISPSILHDKRFLNIRISISLLRIRMNNPDIFNIGFIWAALIILFDPNHFLLLILDLILLD